jgi:hypothetical protein
MVIENFNEKELTVFKSKDNSPSACFMHDYASLVFTIAGQFVQPRSISPWVSTVTFVLFWSQPRVCPCFGICCKSPFHFAQKWRTRVSICCEIFQYSSQIAPYVRHLVSENAIFATTPKQGHTLKPLGDIRKFRMSSTTHAPSPPDSGSNSLAVGIDLRNSTAAIDQCCKT